MSDYIKHLLTEWGRIEAGAVRGPLRAKTMNYGERIARVFEIDDMPISNPDVGRIASFMLMLPPGEYQALFLRYHEDRPVAEACQLLTLSKDKFHDLVASGIRMLDHWLRKDREQNGAWSRYCSEMSRQVDMRRD